MLRSITRASKKVFILNWMSSWLSLWELFPFHLKCVNDNKYGRVYVNMVGDCELFLTRSVRDMSSTYSCRSVYKLRL